MSEGDPQREAEQLPDVPLPEERQQVFGHAPTLATLDDWIASGRVPGAVLLHGPRGIGKATLAFAFAHRLLVATGDEDAHRVHEQIAAGVHPNVFVLRRVMNKTGSNFASAITVGQVAHRKDSAGGAPLIDRLRQTRGRPGFRICVVDAIDDCNPSAANALLKILEEPPPETVFVLVSHQPGGLLPTIRSRCRSLALRTLDDDDMRAFLADTGAAAGDAASIVARAGGRPRRALELVSLSGSQALNALEAFLAGPAEAPHGAQLGVAEALAGASDAEKLIARESIYAHLAHLAREAAIAGPEARNRLATATELWDKANPLFSNADIYNLDVQQTFVILLDAIRTAALRDRANLTDVTS